MLLWRQRNLIRNEELCNCGSNAMFQDTDLCNFKICFKEVFFNLFPLVERMVDVYINASLYLSLIMYIRNIHVVYSNPFHVFIFYLHAVGNEKLALDLISEMDPCYTKAN
jgi:hypothetical protein